MCSTSSPGREPNSAAPAARAGVEADGRRGHEKLIGPHDSRGERAVHRLVRRRHTHAAESAAGGGGDGAAGIAATWEGSFGRAGAISGSALARLFRIRSVSQHLHTTALACIYRTSADISSLFSARGRLLEFWANQGGSSVRPSGRVPAEPSLRVPGGSFNARWPHLRRAGRT